MKNVFLARCAAILILAGSPVVIAPVFAVGAQAAAPCRDATTGKFTKCAPAKPAPCRDAKGKFTKCTTSTPS